MDELKTLAVSSDALSLPRVDSAGSVRAHRSLPFVLHDRVCIFMFSAVDFIILKMVLIFSARARMLWGHAPRVRSAACFRRGLATVADLPTDAQYGLYAQLVASSSTDYLADPQSM